MPGEYYPAPPVHFSGDLGDVFYALSKEGREEKALKSQAARDALKAQIAEPARMSEAQGTDTYLGANNPTDLSQRIAPYQAKTGRMNSETEAGRLKFEQDWAPDRSARGWADSATSNRNADTSAGNAATEAAREKFAENQQPDISALKWAEQGTNQQQADTQSRSADSAEQYRTDSLKAQGDQSTMAALEHMSQFLGSDDGAAIAKIIAARAVPVWDGKTPLSPQQQAIQNFLKTVTEKAKGAADKNKGAAEGAMTKPIGSGDLVDSKFGTADSLNAAADKEGQTKVMHERKTQADGLRKHLAGVEDVMQNGIPGDNSGESFQPNRKLTPQEMRQAALDRAGLQKQIQELEKPFEFNSAVSDTDKSSLDRAFTSASEGDVVPGPGYGAGKQSQAAPAQTSTEDRGKLAGEYQILQQRVAVYKNNGRPVPPQLIEQLNLLGSKLTK